MRDGSSISPVLIVPALPGKPFFLHGSRDPVFLEVALVKNFEISRPAQPELLHTVLIYLRIVPESVYGKIFVDGFKERDLLV